ncbi:O-antigen ligase family protein [Pontibacter sp. 172403-2]|uniref:O-antigen ligase family protein n=1 Tax=Pontibacter rufus TaxID=2791028 RepID=UPI0018AFB209|nr:O-antigen ligase family protein [Pontibacter sp. 172403-2]MBF9253261.1 O-antigen ligase family protein [Pontibacter sp. 172403-2]
MEELTTYRSFTLIKNKKTSKYKLTVVILVYLQLINIITGPDIILKFMGYKYSSIEETNLGWLTTTINIAFIFMSFIVLLNNKSYSVKLLKGSKQLLLMLGLIIFSLVFVPSPMINQSLSSIILSIGAFSKAFSLVILLNKHTLSISDVLLKIVKVIILLMIVYLVLFFQNGFSQVLLGRYQSFFSQPNNLGQFCALAILTLFADKLSKKKGAKLFNNKSIFFFYLTSAICFIIISQSFTTFISIFLVLLTYFLYSIRKKVLKTLILISLALFTAFFFSNSTRLSFQLNGFITKSILSDFNRDLTLTGRTQIWRDVFDKIKNDNKVITGYGIGGFWGKERAPSSQVENSLFTEIGQAHNGLVELCVEYGLLGVILFVSFLVFIVNKLPLIYWQYKDIIFFNFFLIFFIFNNLVEASFLQPKHFLNCIFLLISIIVLNSKKVKTKSIVLINPNI